MRGCRLTREIDESALLYRENTSGNGGGGGTKPEVNF